MRKFLRDALLVSVGINISLFIFFISLGMDDAAVMASLSALLCVAGVTLREK